MRFRTGLKFLALIGLVLVVFGCSNKKNQPEFTVLLRMMPAEQRFFRDEILKPFEKENGCKVNIATFDNQWDIERMLKLEAGKKNTEIGLVKTPFEMTRTLVRKGYMKPLTTVKDSDAVMDDLAEYHPLASGLGFVDGSLYYIPRKLETRVLYYSKSKVADAVSKIDKYRETINGMLKDFNGYGLPEGYVLESDPASWDFYDLFTVGVIWSKEEYNGVKIGRMAHRGAKYGGTSLFLFDRALQLGATSEEISDISSDKTSEMFLWENMLIKAGVYNPGMWQDPWKGSNIYNAIKDGKVFMAYLQQIDCFILHGWDKDPGMPSYLSDQNDMGLSVVPKAVSFALDKNGKPLYEGTNSISVGGWWWGIPKTSPNAELAYKLARYITNKENQAKETSRFGMIPVRKDILLNLNNVFDEGWVGNIFKVSVDQIKQQLDSNKIVTVPLNEDLPELSRKYIDAWYKLCVNYDEKNDGKMNLSTMKMRLADFSSDKSAEDTTGAAK